MKNWTTQAEQRLVEYLGERVTRERLSGEDAAELKDDLRSHVHEEAEQAPGETIGLMQLENILGRLDAGYRPVAEWESGPPPAKSQRFRRFLSWTFGVVLPLGVLIFEMISSFCGQVFFDPVPTWWHAGLLALVPGVNAWLLCGAPRGSGTMKGALAGASLMVALFYGLLFLPIIHLSFIALIVIGMGMLSLTPILAAFASWRIGRAARAGSTEPAHYKSGWRMGALAGVLALVALEGSSLWTRANLTAALMDGGESTSAISRLRKFNSERVLLKACYEGNRGTVMATDISGWIFKGWTIPFAMIDEVAPPMHDSEKARDVFFRVTGKPFNSLKPPKSANGGGLMGRRADPMEDMEFDDHVGGDDVAVRLKYLDLAESRFDGHVDAASRIGYGEWTMVFKNRSSRPRKRGAR